MWGVVRSGREGGRIELEEVCRVCDRGDSCQVAQSASIVKMLCLEACAGFGGSKFSATACVLVILTQVAGGQEDVRGRIFILGEIGARMTQVQTYSRCDERHCNMTVSKL
jgi:hypothetical protein